MSSSCEIIIIMITEILIEKKSFDNILSVSFCFQVVASSLLPDKFLNFMQKVFIDDAIIMPLLFRYYYDDALLNRGICT